MLNFPVYAGRKRSRPHFKRKVDSDDGSEQTNSSKRHRDKLNVELEQLALLLPLPSHVLSRLDKLSVMRLTVSYLRMKAYLSDAVPSCTKESAPHPTTVPEGELMLKALNGFVLIVREDGTVLYTSHNIHDHLGYLQSDVINQSVLELVHADDRAAFMEQLSPAQRGSTEVECEGSKSSRKTTRDSAHSHSAPCRCERSFSCRMHCLLEPNSGFLLMQIQGRVKLLPHTCSEADVPSHFALFATAVRCNPPAIIEIRTRTIIFRSKTKIDFTPITFDKKGREILGWTDKDFINKTGYFYIHQEDLLCCAERHMNIFKTGESGINVFRLLSKDRRWVWVRSFGQMVYKDGQPDFIITTSQVLSDAEGEEHFVRRGYEACFLQDQQSALYGIADMLGVESRSFIQQVEQEHASRRAPGHNSATQDHSQAEEGLGYECRPAVLAQPQPWPCIPSDMSIWELLWRYGLCQDDLELIQRDERICSLSSMDLPELLTLPTAPPTTSLQLTESHNSNLHTPVCVDLTDSTNSPTHCPSAASGRTLLYPSHPGSSADPTDSAHSQFHLPFAASGLIPLNSSHPSSC